MHAKLYLFTTDYVTKEMWNCRTQIRREFVSPVYFPLVLSLFVRSFLCFELGQDSSEQVGFHTIGWQVLLTFSGKINFFNNKYKHIY